MMVKHSQKHTGRCFAFALLACQSSVVWAGCLSAAATAAASNASERENKEIAAAAAATPVRQPPARAARLGDRAGVFGQASECSAKQGYNCVLNEHTEIES